MKRSDRFCLEIKTFVKENIFRRRLEDSTRCLCLDLDLRFLAMAISKVSLNWATVRSLKINQYLAFVSNDGWLMRNEYDGHWHCVLTSCIEAVRTRWSANQMLTPLRLTLPGLVWFGFAYLRAPLRLTLPGGATEYIWIAPLNPCGRHNWRFSQSLQYKLDWSSDCEPPCWPPCLPPCPPSCRPPCHHHVGHHVHLHVGHHVGQFRLGDISNQCHSLYGDDSFSNM